MIPWKSALPENVWLGTTVEDQQAAKKRIPTLIKHKALVRFISCEPLLGAIDITPWLRKKGSIHWVIVGGESGPHARPMNPLWIQSIQDNVRHSMFFSISSNGGAGVHLIMGHSILGIKFIFPIPLGTIL